MTDAELENFFDEVADVKECAIEQMKIIREERDRRKDLMIEGLRSQIARPK